MIHSCVLSLLVVIQVCAYRTDLFFLDTKKGVLYRLENLSFSQVSEEKDSDSKAIVEPIAPKEVLASVPSGDKEEPKEDTTKEEGDEKEEEEVTEAQEDRECIPDDKKDLPVVEEKPTELTELATAPRDNIIT